MFSREDPGFSAAARFLRGTPSELRPPTPSGHRGHLLKLMTRGTVIFLGITIMSASSLCMPQIATSETIYVSNRGSDQWSGKLSEPNAERTDGPLRSIFAARDRIRTARRANAIRSTVTVFIRGGTYRIAEPFILQPEDSGTKDKPVIYAGYPGERAIISGGRQILGWRKASEVEYQKLGFASSPSSSTAPDIWLAAVPEAKERPFTDLFVNGRRVQRARLPHIGYFRIDGQTSEGRPLQVRLDNDQIKESWVDLGDVELVALFAWSDVRMPIRAVNRASHLVTLAGNGLPAVFIWQDGTQSPWANYEVDARYYVDNAPEGLDSPGEWYLDRRTGLLYYWPRPEESMSTAEVVAPFLTELVRLEGDPLADRFVSHLVFRDLTFRDADWQLGPAGYADAQAAVEIGSAISAVGAVEIAFEKCVITCVRGYALHLGAGCKRNRIVANEIFDAGAGGIKLGVGKGGDHIEEPIIYQDDARMNSQNIVSDNEIHDLGSIFPSAVGIWIGHSTDHDTVSHNDIHDLPYSGVSVGWTWGYGPHKCYGHSIEFNHIHHVGKVLSDLGAIYAPGIQPGTVIRNNLIHDVSRFSYGGWGIYLDDGSSQILVENNVVYRTKDGGFHLNFGRDNIVRNNIFAFGEECQLVQSRAEDHLAFTFEHNIVYWNSGYLWRMDDAESWPECSAKNDSNAIRFHPRARCKTYRIDRNVYYDARGWPVDVTGHSFAAWQRSGNDTNSIIADPRFGEANRGDFTIGADSPALRVGFTPIDISQVGPRGRAGR